MKKEPKPKASKQYCMCGKYPYSKDGITCLECEGRLTEQQLKDAKV